MSRIGVISKNVARVLVVAGLFVLAARPVLGREVIRLDGPWELAEGDLETKPETFDRVVPVPGLVDMASPAFEDVGKVSDKRQAFWYRKVFWVEGELPDVAILKIHKAKYGTQVWLNGQFVGRHLPSFTPAHMNVRPHLQGRGLKNELIVRLGANRESLPEGMPTGWDFEKYLYIPGIYDSVELILTDMPYVINVQTVPDIDAGKVRVVTELRAPPGHGPGSITYEISEVASGNLVNRVTPDAGGSLKQDVEIAIPNCRLWTPEDPFLYELKVSTAGDMMRTRFGMRSFRFDAKTGRAMLNNKPYMMRGTNVCVYRFFEDSERGDRPWRRQWVRRLHRKFKSMNWNSIRYCIGFPPEIWYEIADEEGFLIQDEFPIWLLGKAPEKPVAPMIFPEYVEWMRERWNHPCVVIWDAQNESITDETGKALQMVRPLDLSDRPWENGWAAPQSPKDCVESHPYLFIRDWQDKEPFRLEQLADVSPVPRLTEHQKKPAVPIIINEYGWLWLNRDGTPTTLTKKIYENLFPNRSTAWQRRRTYARYLAALTEFWRCGRQAAGVLHFCGLAYSRPGFAPRPEGGATSDHFLDMEELTFEPNFEEYVREAFEPIGLMVDFWKPELPAATQQKFQVVVINDLDVEWKRAVYFAIVDPTVVSLKSLTANPTSGPGREHLQETACSIEPYGRTVLTFETETPDEPGSYRILAWLTREDGRAVRSLRDVKIAAQN